LTKVYVSATFRDLEECRSAVMLALRRLRVEDVAMESYVAEDRRPVERCLADVAECDLYVGIFAWRYGFVPAGYDKSITELEYRHAEALGKPRLIFLLDEEAPWPRVHIDRGPDADQLEALRAELSDRHMCSTFTGPGDLAALVTAAVANCLVELGRPASALHSLSPDVLKRYYDRLHQQYGGLDLDALTPPQREEYLQMRLSSVYIEQSVREDPPPVELPREWWHRMRDDGHLETGDVPEEVDREELALIHQAYRAKPLRRLFDVITAADNRATVLLGDPGSGKSTAARYVALSLATSGAPVDDRLAALAEHLPLFVELRSYAALAAEGRCDTFVEYLDHRATTDGLGLEKAALLNYLAGGGAAVVIFDGLDEIFDRRRRESVASQIAAFAAEHAQVRVLVTSRVIGYSRRVLTEPGFVHFTLQDLDEAQIAEFLTSWYRLAMHDRPDDARARRARLMEAMRHSQSIHELAGNPMLLTILAIIGKHQALPRDRWKLYDHAASVLVEHWDVNRHLQDQYESLDFIDAEDKKELLRRLAYRMQAAAPGLSANYIGAEELSEVFEAYLIERYQRDRADARALARTMINQFRERNFILSRYGAHLYGFVHRTFLEYFCAEAIVGKFKHDQRWPFDRLRELFEQHWADPSWREVLRLVAGALHERHSAQLIDLLTRAVNTPWPPGEFAQPPWNLALAVQCLAEVRNPHSEVAQPAETLLRHVVLLLEHCVSINDRDTMALIEEEILPAARAIGSTWPGREAYLTWYRRRGVRLIWSSVSADAARLAAVLATPTEHVEDLFGGVLGALDDRRAAYASVAGLAELAQVASTAANRSAYHIALGKARAQLVARAREDGYAGVRLAAVEALGERFGTDPLVRDVLIERARGDGYAAVRLAAVRALGERFRAWPAVRELLLDRARRDGNASVRRAAVQTMERVSLDDELREALVDRVRTDRDAEVVGVAARALHDRGDDEPLREALVERIRAEPDGVIRRAAVRVLAERLAAGTRVHDLLITCVREDVDPGVLTAAARALVERFDAGDTVRDLIVERARHDPDETARRATVQIARELFVTDPAVRTALAARVRQDRAADVRLTAIRALSVGLATDPSGATALGEVACEDTDPAVRLAAVQALVGKIGLDTAVCKVLARVIDDDGDATVRLEAVRALATRCAGDAAVRRQLVDRAREDGHADVRGAALAVLAAHALGHPEVAELLVERVRDEPDGSVFAVAAGAATGSSVRGLIAGRARDDANPRVREAAVRALVARFGADSPVREELLSRIRHDLDPRVVAEAAVALATRAGTDLEQCDLLLRRSQDDDPTVREAVARVLGDWYGADPSVRALLVGLASSDADLPVRREALRVLGERLAGYDDVRSLLVHSVRDGDWSVREAAVRFLCQHHGTDPAVRSLLVELARDDPDPNFRRLVGQGLSWLPEADLSQLPDIDT
jgi:hypothetical protein